MRNAIFSQMKIINMFAALIKYFVKKQSRNSDFIIIKIESDDTLRISDILSTVETKIVEAFIILPKLLLKFLI